MAFSNTRVLFWAGRKDLRQAEKPAAFRFCQSYGNIFSFVVDVTTCARCRFRSIFLFDV